MSAASPATPRPRRRFRFTLRTLFIAVTILCCWLGWKVNAARKQRDAAEVVRRNVVGWHGSLWYDYDFDLDSMQLRAQREPHWLANLLGVDMFHDVVSVGVWMPDSEVFPHLANLPKLVNLSITNCDFKDEDCKYLAGLKNLNL
jgi:hypothetical protein